MPRSSALCICLCGLAGALSIGLGAYAAHGLGPDPDPRQLSLMDKAVRHLMYAAVGWGVVAWLAQLRSAGNSVLVIISAVGQAMGCLFFCGALIGIALFDFDLAHFAPIGGVSFILAWLCLAVIGARAYFFR